MGQDKPTQLGPLERASLNHCPFNDIDCDFGSNYGVVIDFCNRCISYGKEGIRKNADSVREK
jgi:hypothetical protein